MSLGSTAAGYGIMLDGVGWAYLVISLALCTALVVIWRKPSAPEYGLTVIWALVWIIVANFNSQTGVATLAGLGITVVAGATWKMRSPA